MSEQKPAAAPATPALPAAREQGKDATTKKAAAKTDTFNKPRGRKEGQSTDPLLSYFFAEAHKYARLCIVLPNGFIQGIDDPAQLSVVGNRIVWTTNKGIYTVRDMFLQQPVDTPIVSKLESTTKELAIVTAKGIVDAQAKKRLEDALKLKEAEMAELKRKLGDAGAPAKKR